MLTGFKVIVELYESWDMGEQAEEFRTNEAAGGKIQELPNDE